MTMYFMVCVLLLTLTNVNANASGQVQEKGKLLPATYEPTHAVLDKNMVQLKSGNSMQDVKAPYVPVSNATDAWTTITTQTYEGDFPTTGWSCYATAGFTNAYWDDQSSYYHAGGWSAWCADAGSAALNASSGAYANNMNAWMVYGPFNLSDATSGDMTFFLKSNTESGWDYFKCMASTDGTNFYGWSQTGSTGGWISQTLDFTNIATLGNICGRSSVYIAFNFKTDGSISSYAGAFVDDVVIRKNAGPIVAPIINVNPTVMTASMAPGTTLAQSLTISNTGTAPLNWQIVEGAGSVVGNWTWYYDWDCTGSYSNTSLIINADGTWSSSSYTGVWTLNGDQLALTFPSGTVYTGTVAGNTVTGTMLSYEGDTGCFYLQRVLTNNQSQLIPAVGSPKGFNEEGKNQSKLNYAKPQSSSPKETAVSTVSWLSTTPLTGTVAVGSSQIVTVTYNSTGLVSGAYNTNISISSDDPNHLTTLVPVQMTVTSCAAPAAPVIGAITHPTCLLVTGSVVLTGLPATGNWTLTRSPGGVTTTGTGTSATVSGIPPGNYTFSVTNSTGCTSSSSAILTINALPTPPTAPTIGATTQPTCVVVTGTVGLNGLPATGTWTLTRTPGAIITTGTGTSTSISGLEPGTYTYTVTNAVGCTSAASAPILINALPPAPPAPVVGTITQPTCLVATGGVELSGLPASGTWTLISTPGGITTTGTGTTASVAGLASGTYTYTVTNSLGCISAASVNVIVMPQPETPAAPLAGAINQPTCLVETGSIELSGLPATGTWSLTATPGGAIGSGTGTTTTIVSLAPGTYNYMVTNESGCSSPVSADMVITPQPETPGAPNVGPIVQPTCALPSGNVFLFDLPATGTWTLTRSDGVTTAGSGKSITVDQIPTGNFTYTVTNEVGCTSAGSATVGINEQPPVPVAPAIGPITQPTSTVATGSVFLFELPASDTWTLTRSDGVTATGTGSNKTLTEIPVGTYNFIVTNSIGCVSEPSADVVIKAYVGIGFTGKNNLITIYPNPVSSMLLIEMEGNNKSVSYEILDLTGQVVAKGNFVEKTAVPTAEFTPGVYMIRIDDGKAVELRKVVKE